MATIHFATAAHIELLAEHGPYRLRDDGVIEDRNGVALADMRCGNLSAEECDWDRALVAALNDIHAARRTQ